MVNNAFAIERNCRFPCSIADCKKEYRTQWELNNHCRTKHRSDIARQGAKDKSVAELPVAEQVKIEYKKPTPTKTRNKQKIIYVLPGPQSNYVSLHKCSYEVIAFPICLIFSIIFHSHRMNTYRSIEIFVSTHKQSSKHRKWITIISGQMKLQW